MPEKPLIATHVLGAYALLGAGIVQLGILLMLGVKFRPAQLIGAMIVACFIGGGSAMLLQEYLHVNSFISGVVGTGTGLIPAALSTSIITRKDARQGLYDYNDRPWPQPLSPESPTTLAFTSTSSPAAAGPFSSSTKALTSSPSPTTTSSAITRRTSSLSDQ